MAAWGIHDYQLWTSSGCDKKSAAGVVYLIFSYSNSGINLHAKGLFKHFVNLRRLDLSYCGLTTIPEKVWELTQLEYLYVNNNYIRKISPKIKNLTNLKHFNCNSNNLTAIPDEICQLTKLNGFLL